MQTSVSATTRMSRKDGEESVIHIPPFFYIHVWDQNTNMTTLHIGPRTYTCKDSQRVVLGPERMISIPRGSFCIVENPVARDKDGQAVLGKDGQVTLRHADQETRLSQEPFALYPGEVLKQGVSPLRVVTANTALRLRALIDFVEEQKGEGKGKGEIKEGEKEKRKRERQDEGKDEEKIKGKEEKRGGQGEGKETMEGKEGDEGTGNGKEEKGKGNEDGKEERKEEGEEGKKEGTEEEKIDEKEGKEKEKKKEGEKESKGKEEHKEKEKREGKGAGQGEEKKEGIKRTAGDEWLFKGPGTYIPRNEVSVEETIKASVVKPNQAIKLRARKDCTDSEGKERVTGEEWLVKETGAYLPGVYEEVVDVVNAYVLTKKKALHMRCLGKFKDDFDVERKYGEEWLIEMSEKKKTHIPDVYEEVVSVVDVTTLTSRQYCVVLEPVDDKGKPQLGRKKLIQGEKSFFLKPGERLENGIQNIYVLGEQEGLILRALRAFSDFSFVSSAVSPAPCSSAKSTAPLSGGSMLQPHVCPPAVCMHGLVNVVRRQPGDRWMIKGPTEYVPPVEVEVVCKRQAIPLDKNEGIYVRNLKDGKVRAVSGEMYMLTQDEELWEKELPPSTEELLVTGKDPLSDRGIRSLSSLNKGRDKTRVVTFLVPHKAAVQVYDYKDQKARIVFGPDLVVLQPDEQFTQLNLSGGKPKKPNAIKALYLLLGPDLCKDIITVETADHVRLLLQLSYNWHFRVPEGNNSEAASKLFSIPDFVGDACNAIASCVRSAVTEVKFDDFHQKSAEIIQRSLFGVSDSGVIRNEFVFEQNNLVITRVDLLSVEHVDQQTRDAMQKLVTKRLEQKTKGLLELQKLIDEAMVEIERTRLLEPKHTQFCELTREHEAEEQYLSKQNERKLYEAKNMAEVEVTQFTKMVEAIGADTLKTMAMAGPEMQVRLLQSLGLKSTLITDGSSPINLFDTANGLIGGGIAALRPVNSRREPPATDCLNKH